jgi:hypothetical protein
MSVNHLKGARRRVGERAVASPDAQLPAFTQAQARHAFVPHPDARRIRAWSDMKLVLQPIGPNADRCVDAGPHASVQHLAIRWQIGLPGAFITASKVIDSRAIGLPRLGARRLPRTGELEAQRDAPIGGRLEGERQAGIRCEDRMGAAPTVEADLSIVLSNIGLEDRWNNNGDSRAGRRRSEERSRFVCARMLNGEENSCAADDEYPQPTRFSSHDFPPSNDLFQYSMLSQLECSSRQLNSNSAASIKQEACRPVSG